MAIMVGVVGALSAFYHNDLDITIPEQARKPNPNPNSDPNPKP